MWQSVCSSLSLLASGYNFVHVKDAELQCTYRVWIGALYRARCLCLCAVCALDTTQVWLCCVSVSVC